MWVPTPYADAEAMPAPTDPSRPTPNHAPVADEITLTDIDVEGTLPAALTGRYLRIGPNRLTPAEPGDEQHRLDGMVHAVDLRVGRALRYRARWVTTDRVARILGATPVPGLAATASDTVATNVVAFGGRTLALGPGALAYELDAQLATVGRVDLAGHGRGIGAHPQIDSMTGALHLVSHGEEPAHHIVAPNGQTRITTAVDDAPGPLEDILLTRDRFVLLGEGFVGVADRSGQTTTRWTDADLPVAVTAQENPSVVAALDLEGAVVVLSVNRSLLRWTFDAAGAQRHVVDDTPQRFGTTNSDRTSAPTYVWTVAGTGGTEAYRHDLRTGTRTSHDFGPGRRPGELAFVPDPTRRHREDGGWLVGLIQDDHGNDGDLVVLDAAALDRPAIARVQIPRRIPHGLHGTWIPATT